MKLSSGYEQKRARVEMIPLIDVMFLLLISFVYSTLSMVMHRGMPVRLPDAVSAVIDKRDYVAVTITRDNRTFVNDEEVPLTRVAERVAERVQVGGAEPLPVFIDGDRGADLGPAVRVLDDLRQRGIRDISFSCSQKAE